MDEYGPTVKDVGNRKNDLVSILAQKERGDFVLGLRLLPNKIRGHGCYNKRGTQANLFRVKPELQA